MTENNVIALAGREAGGDQVTELLRNGARTLIAQALEAEVTQLLERFQDHRDEMGAALEIPVGSEAKEWSARTVSRPKRVWAAEYKIWQHWRLDDNRWVYVWADGIYWFYPDSPDTQLRAVD